MLPWAPDARRRGESFQPQVIHEEGDHTKLAEFSRVRCQVHHKDATQAVVMLFANVLETLVVVDEISRPVQYQFATVDFHPADVMRRVPVDHVDAALVNEAVRQIASSRQLCLVFAAQRPVGSPVNGDDTQGIFLLLLVCAECAPDNGHGSVHVVVRVERRQASDTGLTARSPPRRRCSRATCRKGENLHLGFWLVRSGHDSRHHGLRTAGSASYEAKRRTLELRKQG